MAYHAPVHTMGLVLLAVVGGSTPVRERLGQSQHVEAIAYKARIYCGRGQTCSGAMYSSCSHLLPTSNLLV